MRENSQKITPKVALVYDKVNTTYGGAEWVLTTLHELFPDAPLYTSLYSPKRTPWSKVFTVVPSFLQKLPIKNHKLLVWLFPLAFESFTFDEFDVIISITSGEAKGILTKPNQVHLSYVLTPPRYLYTHQEKYLEDHPVFSLPVLRSILKLPLYYLTWWDKAAAFRPDALIAISKRIQSRITDTYSRTSDIIYPPLPEIPTPSKHQVAELSKTKWFLSLSRLVGYKRVDLSLAACLETNRTLVIAGEGEQKRNLIAQAGDKARIRDYSEDVLAFIKDHSSTQGTILFVGHVTNEERTLLLAATECLLMPGLEDFGITALEAASLGTPSILHEQSGVSEVLKHGTSALHIKKETTTEILSALSQVEKTTWSSATLQREALTCSTKVFTSKMHDYVYDSIIHLKNDSKI